MSRLKPLILTTLTHEGFRRYFANTSWMFGEHLLRMIAGLLVGLWMARYLGPEQFGLFSYVIAFASLFGSIAKLGLDDIVVRDLVRQPLQRDVYLGTAFWLKFVGAFMMLCILGLAALFSINSNTINIYIFIIGSGIIFQSFEVIDFYFKSQVLSKFVSICKITQLAVSSSLKIYFVVMQADFIWFVIVSLIDQVLLGITFLIAYRHQKLGSFHRNFDLNAAKKMLKDSWPLMLSGLVIAFYMRIDQIMIKQILGNKEVGLYSAAVKLVEVWYFIPTLITASIFPLIVKTGKSNTKLYINLLQRLYTFMFFFALIVAISVSFLNEELIDILYGDSFKDAGPILAILIWIIIPVAIGVVWSSWLIAENHPNVALISHLVGGILNITLNYYLIPLYGISGCAIATLISYFISAILGLSIYKGKFTFLLILGLHKNERN